MKGVPVDLVFSDEESRSLTKSLLKIKTNPYTNYPGFRVEINKLVEDGSRIPEALQEACFRKR
jgi:hypothetical protein